MLSFGIKRKGAFKENVGTPDNCSKSVCACAYDPFHFLRVAENFLAISLDFVVSLVEAAASDEDFEMAIQLRIKNVGGVRKFIEQLGRYCGHRAAHVSFGENAVNRSVTFCTSLGAHVLIAQTIVSR